MPEESEAHRLVNRHTQLLKLFIKSRGSNVRAMERRLQLGAGSLNRIFNGRNELKVRHIMMILNELGIEPSAYYRCLTRGEDPKRTQLEAVAELLEAMAPKARSDDELELRMRRIFERLVAEQNTAPAA